VYKTYDHKKKFQRANKGLLAVSAFNTAGKSFKLKNAMKNSMQGLASLAKEEPREECEPARAAVSRPARVGWNSDQRTAELALRYDMDHGDDYDWEASGKTHGAERKVHGFGSGTLARRRFSREGEGADAMYETSSGFGGSGGGSGFGHGHQKRNGGQKEGGEEEGEERRRRRRRQNARPGESPALGATPALRTRASSPSPGSPTGSPRPASRGSDRCGSSSGPNPRPDPRPGSEPGVLDFLAMNRIFIGNVNPRTRQSDLERVLGGLGGAAVGNLLRGARVAMGASVFEGGEAVEARVEGKGEHRPGKIQKVNSDGTYDVLFDDGDRDPAVAASSIRKVCGGGAGTFGIGEYETRAACESAAAAAAAAMAAAADGSGSPIVLDGFELLIRRATEDDYHRLVRACGSAAVISSPGGAGAGGRPPSRLLSPLPSPLSPSRTLPPSGNGNGSGMGMDLMGVSLGVRGGRSGSTDAPADCMGEMTEAQRTQLAGLFYGTETQPPWAGRVDELWRVLQDQGEGEGGGPSRAAVRAWVKAQGRADRTTDRTDKTVRSGSLLDGSALIELASDGAASASADSRLGGEGTGSNDSSEGEVSQLLRTLRYCEHVSTFAEAGHATLAGLRELSPTEIARTTTAVPLAHAERILLAAGAWGNEVAGLLCGLGCGHCVPEFALGGHSTLAGLREVPPADLAKATGCRLPQAKRVLLAARQRMGDFSLPSAVLYAGRGNGTRPKPRTFASSVPAQAFIFPGARGQAAGGAAGGGGAVSGASGASSSGGGRGQQRKAKKGLVPLATATSWYAERRRPGSDWAGGAGCRNNGKKGAGTMMMRVRYGTAQLRSRHGIDQGEGARPVGDPMHASQTRLRPFGFSS
jgi:hypothetical protein